MSKNEFQGQTELMMIFMNMVPLNHVVSCNPLHLQPHDNLLVSSEGVRASFCIAKVPKSWQRFLCFNRLLPPEMCGEKRLQRSAPDGLEEFGGPCSARAPL